MRRLIILGKDVHYFYVIASEMGCLTGYAPALPSSQEGMLLLQYRHHLIDGKWRVRPVPPRLYLCIDNAASMMLDFVPINWRENLKGVCSPKK